MNESIIKFRGGILYSNNGPLEDLGCVIQCFERNSPMKENWLRTNRRTDRQTNRRTNRRTDRPSYRDAWTHLKNISEEFEASIFLVHFIEKDVKDVKDVQDVQTEGTDPHIEMSVFMRVNIPAFTKNKENCFSRRPTISKKMTSDNPHLRCCMINNLLGLF